MISLAILFYFFGLEACIYFTVLNLIGSIGIYIKIKKDYYTTKKDKETGKDMHEAYPSFCRTDECPSFQRLFLGFISFAWLKMILFISAVLNCYIWVRILRFFRKDPNASSAFSFKICQYTNYILTKIAGIFPIRVYNKEKVIQVYKKYLGEGFDYDKEIKSKDYACAISYHIGWIDIFFCESITGASFAAKSSVKKMPIVGLICDCMDTVWIDRGDKSASKDAAISINHRQELIMNGKIKNKLFLFPEGTGSNNRGLNIFKKGAFYLLNPVKPFCQLVYRNGRVSKEEEEKRHKTEDSFSLGAGGMKLAFHLITSFCFLYFSEYTCLDLPVITPNEYMYEKYGDIAKDKPSIFAEVTRRIMSECSGLELIEAQFEDKLTYLSKIKGKVISNT